jgi:hypothetical protein
VGYSNWAGAYPLMYIAVTLVHRPIGLKAQGTTIANWKLAGHAGHPCAASASGGGRARTGIPWRAQLWYWVADRWGLLGMGPTCQWQYARGTTRMARERIRVRPNTWARGCWMVSYLKPCQSHKRRATEKEKVVRNTNIARLCFLLTPNPTDLVHSHVVPPKFM